MENVKVVSTPLATHYKLSVIESFKWSWEGIYKQSYLCVCGEQFNVCVCTRPDIAHVVGIVNRFCQTQVESIGMLWNGFWDIFMVLLIWSFVLEVISLIWCDTQI